MTTKKAPAKKKSTAKKKPAKKSSAVKVTAGDLDRIDKAAATPRPRPTGGHAGRPRMAVQIREKDLDADVLKFIRTVERCGGFKSSNEVVSAMIRMSMDGARTMGARYFGPHLKRYHK